MDEGSTRPWSMARGKRRRLTLDSRVTTVVPGPTGLLPFTASSHLTLTPDPLASGNPQQSSSCLGHLALVSFSSREYGRDVH